MRLEWSSRALSDLQRFAAFLADQYPDLSERIASALAQKVSPLATFPKLGSAIAKRAHFRSIVVNALNGSYVVQYQIIGSETVRVLRVFHAREARD